MSSQKPSPASLYHFEAVGFFECEHVRRLIYRRTYRTSSLLYNIWAHKKSLAKMCDSVTKIGIIKNISSSKLLRLVESDTFGLHFLKGLIKKKLTKILKI